MIKAQSRRTLWLLLGIIAGLVLALGHGRLSGLIYAGAQATPGRAADRTPVTIDRAPQRAIKDQYPSFSAVAIDPEENMLVVTDENLFQVLEYDRRENTPPRARLTEPKRVISGANTRAEMLCGGDIDPGTKEVYVFIKDKLIFVSNFGNAQVSPPGSGGGRRAADTYGKFEPPSITVYPLDASGNVKPLRIIEGSKTRMNWPSQMAFHEPRQELFVANDADDSILVFRAGDQGDVAPIRAIKGPNTGIKNPPGIALDIKNGEVSVASMGTHAVLFFPVTADGDVKPSRIIRGGPSDQIALNIGNPGAVGYDTKRDQILVPN